MPRITFAAGCTRPALQWGVPVALVWVAIGAGALASTLFDGLRLSLGVPVFVVVIVLMLARLAIEWDDQCFRVARVWAETRLRTGLRAPRLDGVVRYASAETRR